MRHERLKNLYQFVTGTVMKIEESGDRHLRIVNIRTRVQECI